MKANYVLINIKEVTRRLCMSRSSIYRRLNPNDPSYDPSFPKPVKLGDSITRWVESEINQWLQSNLNSRKSA
ncbi:MAG: AlpA family phage regulatory protein [Methyloprofundus sp.]|nr:AlpA family phage regulatory protein [Methyloprofundus sp.]